ncbi:MAG TPA: hypothetical protein VFP25_01890 [Nitrososphaeraceae archaeon]|nr:hypothetical protein [Nitrososphaeraceae archaeon]
MTARALDTNEIVTAHTPTAIYLSFFVVISSMSFSVALKTITYSVTMKVQSFCCCFCLLFCSSVIYKLGDYSAGIYDTYLLVISARRPYSNHIFYNP